MKLSPALHILGKLLLYLSLILLLPAFVSIFDSFKGGLSFIGVALISFLTAVILLFFNKKGNLD